MKHKTCSKCGKSKTIDKFSTSKTGTWCKECMSEYGKNRWRKLSQEYKDIRREKHRQRRTNSRAKLFEYLLGKKCECGESDPILLEFDHINPNNKDRSIAQLAGSSCSWPRILKEILKCRILCVRCHRHKTAKEQGWYKYTKRK